MNQITLDGIIRDIQDSHVINDVQYQKAHFIVRNSNGKESILNLQFKKFQCNAKEGDHLSIIGNVRSYSQKISETKNHVTVYVFTNFDEAEPTEENTPQPATFLVDGRTCKIEELRKLENDKVNIHFILANNIFQGTSKLNSYLPCIAWGKCAKEISKLQKNDNIVITGELRSREYKKPLGNGEFEIRMAHELVVTDFRKLQNEEQLSVS